MFLCMQARERKVARLESQLDKQAKRSEVAANVLQGQLQQQRDRVMDLVMLNKVMQVCNLFIVCCCHFHGMLVLGCCVHHRSYTQLAFCTSDLAASDALFVNCGLLCNWARDAA